MTAGAALCRDQLLRSHSDDRGKTVVGPAALPDRRQFVVSTVQFVEVYKYFIGSAAVQVLTLLSPCKLLLTVALSRSTLHIPILSLVLELT